MNYEDMEALFFPDAERDERAEREEREEEAGFTQPQVWRTQDGREILIKDMDERHLLNSIRFMAAKQAELTLVGLEIEGLPSAASKKFERRQQARMAEKLKILVKEARRRNLQGWLKFGLSHAALEIIDQIED